MNASSHSLVLSQSDLEHGPLAYLERSGFPSQDVSGRPSLDRLARTMDMARSPSVDGTPVCRFQSRRADGSAVRLDVLLCAPLAVLARRLDVDRPIEIVMATQLSSRLAADALIAPHTARRHGDGFAASAEWWAGLWDPATTAHTRHRSLRGEHVDLDHLDVVRVDITGATGADGVSYARHPTLGYFELIATGDDRDVVALSATPVHLWCAFNDSLVAWARAHHLPEVPMVGA